MYSLPDLPFRNRWDSFSWYKIPFKLSQNDAYFSKCQVIECLPLFYKKSQRTLHRLFRSYFPKAFQKGGGIMISVGVVDYAFACGSSTNFYLHKSCP